MIDRQQLIEWLKMYAVSTNQEMRLTSGQLSRTYINVKKVAQHHGMYKTLAKLLCEIAYQEFDSFNAVAGVALGGCHLASIVAMRSEVSLDVVFVRKSVKDYGTHQLIERPEMHQGQSVLLLEDVLTTGESAFTAGKLLEQEGYHVSGILAVLDRRIIPGSTIGDFKCSALVRVEELNI
jgi:orotate phosphoribosyltransferase